MRFARYKLYAAMVVEADQWFKYIDRLTIEGISFLIAQFREVLSI